MRIDEEALKTSMIGLYNVGVRLIGRQMRKQFRESLHEQSNSYFGIFGLDLW